jgi:hypothetical protein
VRECITCQRTMYRRFIEEHPHYQRDYDRAHRSSPKGRGWSREKCPSY